MPFVREQSGGTVHVRAVCRSSNSGAQIFIDRKYSTMTISKHSGDTAGHLNITKDNTTDVISVSALPKTYSISDVTTSVAVTAYSDISNMISVDIVLE